ncbi:thermonuclease family protein [Rhizobium daejeonense]|uniref:Thermonuclease family protein n=1 Tax=Rhizobium daejeonense TaxID=240521 RepID=A0A6M1S3E0_9HYPH|nr:thermonuclease family protein [Rhizobium daejeonense]NGO62908.1 thermonuclease family protein [Rhizobium daejeonense]
MLMLSLLIVAKLERQQETEFSGRFFVVDGDTLALGSQRLRLEGIDAPEAGQSCGEANAAWACGATARARLSEIATMKALTCRGSQADRYRRQLVRCRTSGDGDVGAVLVGEGLAVAYGDYEAEEAKAQRERLGVWGGSFTRPHEWRRIHQDDQPEPEVGFFAFLLDWLGVN